MAAQCVSAPIEGSPYGLHRLPHLGSSLLQVLIPNEVQSMWKEEAWQTNAGRSARTLAKYPDLRIVLVSMNAGTRFKQHKTSARFAVLTLAGHVRLHLPNATVEVPRGELLALDRDFSHDVEAIRQSTFLLILARPDREEQHLFPMLATKANVSTRRELESLERGHRSAKQLVGQWQQFTSTTRQWCGTVLSICSSSSPNCTPRISGKRTSCCFR